MPATLPAPLADKSESLRDDARPSLQSKRGAGAVFLLACLIALWCLLIRRFGEGNVYPVIGPFACAVSILSLATAPSELLRELRPTARAVGIGVAVGVVMTVLTYPAFQLASYLYPRLDVDVRVLYS